MAGKRDQKNFVTMVGEGTDSPPWKDVQSFERFVGFDITGPGDKGGPVAITTVGYELRNNVPCQQNPDGGSTGAYANTISLMVRRDPDVKGNTFYSIHNGDGNVGSKSVSVGRQGEFLSAYQELWEGPPVWVASRNIAEPPAPPEPPPDPEWLLVGDAPPPEEFFFLSTKYEDDFDAADQVNILSVGNNQSRDEISNSTSVDIVYTLGRDGSGLTWIGEYTIATTTLSIKTITQEGTVSAQIGSITDWDQTDSPLNTNLDTICCVPALDGDGLLALRSRGTISYQPKLYSFKAAGVTLLGTLALDMGTGATQYWFARGLCWTTDSQLLTMTAIRGTTNLTRIVYAVKFSPTDATIASGFPTSLGIATSSGPYWGTTLNVAANSRYYFAMEQQTGASTVSNRTFLFGLSGSTVTPGPAQIGTMPSGMLNDEFYGASMQIDRNGDILLATKGHRVLCYNSSWSEFTTDISDPYDPDTGEGDPFFVAAHGSTASNPITSGSAPGCWKGPLYDETSAWFVCGYDLRKCMPALRAYTEAGSVVWTRTLGAPSDETDSFGMDNASVSPTAAGYVSGAVSFTTAFSEVDQFPQDVLDSQAVPTGRRVESPRRFYGTLTTTLQYNEEDLEWSWTATPVSGQYFVTPSGSANNGFGYGIGCYASIGWCAGRTVDLGGESWYILTEALGL